jgi:transposase
MERASLEEFLNQGLSLAEIGKRVGRHEATVSYWLKKHGLKAVNREKHTAKGGLDRGELERMVNAGASIAEIAAKLDRSKATVRHWLKQYGLQTLAPSGAPSRPGVDEARLNEHTETRSGVPPPRERPAHSGWSRLLQVPSMSGRGGRPSPSQGQGDARGGGRWQMPSLWLQPLSCGPRVSSSRPGDQEVWTITTRRAQHCHTAV